MRERNAARQRLIDVEGQVRWDGAELHVYVSRGRVPSAAMARVSQWPFVIPHQPLEKLPLQIQPHYIGVPIKV